MRSFLLLSACAGVLFACAGQAGDDSMYLTGSEQYAIQNEDGSWSCEKPKKVLICHIPPGNPDNAHTICVGEPAVDPHQRLHGDTLDPCDGQPADDDGDGMGDDDGDDGAGGDDGDNGDGGDGGDDGSDDGLPDASPESPADAGSVD